MARKRSGDTIAALLSAPGLAPVRDEPTETAGPPAENDAFSADAPAKNDGSLRVTSDVTAVLQPGEQVYEAIAEPVRPSHLRPAEHIHPSQMPPVGEDELDDEDLEAFAFDTDAPLVRPRRREQKDYQTVRINRPTAKILRAQWLLARQIDPLMSYTEFSTIVVQQGLRALKEQRERGE